MIQIVEPNGDFRFEVQQHNISSRSIKYFDYEKKWCVCMNLLNEGFDINEYALEALS